MLNALGYEPLQNGKTEDAIRLFDRNVREFPESSSVYDSLGEAYATAGKKDQAVKNYEKSLKMDSKNENAKERLKKQKGE